MHHRIEGSHGHREEGVPLKRMLKVVALVAVLGIVAAACGGDNGDRVTPRATGAPAPAATCSGGTLQMAMLADVSAAFDPQKEYYCVTWEYYRCCLLRTLMSYKGVPTAEGGAEIFPDLAAAEPTSLGRPAHLDVHDQAGRALRRPVHGRRGHGAGLHPRAGAGGQPQGQRRAATPSTTA